MFLIIKKLTCKGKARVASVGGNHINPCYIGHCLIVQFQRCPKVYNNS
jgi:hypothetical protein